MLVGLPQELMLMEGQYVPERNLVSDLSARPLLLKISKLAHTQTRHLDLNLVVHMNQIWIRTPIRNMWKLM